MDNITQILKGKLKNINATGSPTVDDQVSGEPAHLAREDWQKGINAMTSLDNGPLP